MVSFVILFFNYMKILELHMANLIGHCVLIKLNSNDCQSTHINKGFLKANEKTKIGNGKYGIRRLAKIHHVFSCQFRKWHLYGVITYNGIVKQNSYINITTYFTEVSNV